MNGSDKTILRDMNQVCTTQQMACNFITYKLIYINLNSVIVSEDWYSNVVDCDLWLVCRVTAVGAIDVR